jgi:hypothetical protein
LTPFRWLSYLPSVLRRTLVAVLLVALPVLSSCSGGDGDPGPSASVETTTSRPSTTSSSVAMTPEQEVEAAYLRSWDVYAKAVRELDPTGLEESYTGDALDTVRAEVADFAAAGTPVVVKVEHDLTVGVLTPDRALVNDTYVNRNYRVDAKGEPIDDTNDPGTYEDRYQLDLVDGRWLVSRIERLSYQP